MSKLGSLSDPKEFPGLAHFLEHMLFMGTETNPNEDAYSEYLSTNNGYSNAYTDLEETNYYFSVDSTALNGALDLFAGFFTCPLLKADGVYREMNAVNNEHQKNLQNDGWRLFQMLKDSSNPKYPFHNFGTGDLATLNKTGVREALVNFHQTYYSANIMTLVIYGSEPIEALSNYVYEKFGNIRNNNRKVPSWSPELPFPVQFKGRRRFIIPVTDMNVVSLIWSLKSTQYDYLYDPIGYVTSFINNKMQGSLSSILYKKGYTIDISASVEDNTDFALFQIDIKLTPLGLKEVDIGISPKIIIFYYYFIT